MAGLVGVGMGLRVRADGALEVTEIVPQGPVARCAQVYTHTHTITHSLTQSLTHSLTHSFIHALKAVNGRDVDNT